jgi:large subunit ribosomal protein L35
MVPPRAPSAHLLRSLRALTVDAVLGNGAARSFTTSARRQDEVQAESTSSFYRNPDPATVFVPRLERRLARAGTPPIGSRRRRVALAQSPGIPFDQLPYQCFQEARKILQDDRQEKIQQIETERARIVRLRAIKPEDSAGEAYKQKRLKSMGITLEKLKILADINDPGVKRRFEDGLGMITGSNSRPS